LGKGNFSEVKLAIHPKTQIQVAAKVMDLLSWNKEFKNEITILERLKHPSIIRLIDKEKRSDGRGVIYLEYHSDPTLSFYIQNFSTLSETVAVKVLYGLVDAVSYLHTLGISHHDIKPDNILYNSDFNTIKLFDFGLAISVNPDDPFSNCNAGSPLYMAPEVLSKDTHNVFVADVWSMGITLYEMLIGKTPFSHCKTLEDLEIEWSKRKDLSLPVFVCSTYLRMIYSQMVSYYPQRRITAFELKQKLSTTFQKKCIGNSLGEGSQIRKAQRSTSVQAVVRRVINNKKTKKIKI
jgi:serine/threonine protein kinase